MLGIFLALLSIICLYGRDFSDFNSLRADILEPEKEADISLPVTGTYLYIYIYVYIYLSNI
jgi:hypothetical protein